MQVIKIGGKAPAPVGVVQATEQAGPGLARAEDGTYLMVLTFPGVAPVIIPPEGVENMIAALVQAADLDMTDRADRVFARNLVVDAEGNVTSKFSDAPRARSLTIPRAEIVAMISLLEERLDKYDEHVAVASKM
jgi:hypothetical protein